MSSGEEILPSWAIALAGVGMLGALAWAARKPWERPVCVYVVIIYRPAWNCWLVQQREWPTFYSRSQFNEFHITRYCAALWEAHNLGFNEDEAAMLQAPQWALDERERIEASNNA